MIKLALRTLLDVFSLKNEAVSKKEVINMGFRKTKCLPWRKFIDYVNNQNCDGYIWRGQRCENWPLIPTLDRLLKKTEISEEERADFQNRHLAQFQYAVRGRRGAHPAPIEDANDWWALGQHYGLATPLLDWTTSPFAAAYFAFIDVGTDQTPHRAVYALHRATLEPQDCKVKCNREVKFIRPNSNENHRLVNQSGLFTRTPDGITLNEWVIKNNLVDEDPPLLMKLLIPNGDREECLLTLNRMNINHLTLFPDIDGASKFCNILGEITKYRDGP